MSRRQAGRFGRCGTRCAAVLGLGAALLAACDFPRDADGTLDRVRGGTMRVGLLVNAPWVSAVAPEPAGAEVRLVEQLAGELGAQVSWTTGGEADLINSLKFRELDLVVGGLDEEAPWQQDASLTREYVKTQVVVGVPRGQSLPADLEGVRIAVEEGTEEAGVLSERVGAVPVRMPDVAEAARTGDVPVAVEDWRLDSLGLADTGVALSTTARVVAVPPGENGWQVTVERFLLAKSDEEVYRLLAEEEQ